MFICLKFCISIQFAQKGDFLNNRQSSQRQFTVKKRLAIFLPTVLMLLTKLSLDGKNLKGV
jgi:hypothetical protein